MTYFFLNTIIIIKFYTHPNLPEKRVWTNKHKDAWTSSWPRIRQVSTEDKSEKTKLLLLMGLQKIESHASGSARVSSSLWKLIFVIYTSEMLSNTHKYEMFHSLIILWSLWFFSHRNDETLRWYCHQISHASVNIQVAVLYSRSIKSETKFNESCTGDWKCKEVNNHVVSNSNFYSH